MSGCWLWGRFIAKDGYGRTNSNGRKTTAHRAVWEQLVGPVPDGLELDHLCRNRACVNPDHLEPVTHRENILRGESPSAKWAARDSCELGHTLDDGNIYRVRGVRRCRTCALARVKAYKAERRRGPFSEQRTCEECATAFEAHAITARFCSRNCWQRNYRREGRAA